MKKLLLAPLLLSLAVPGAVSHAVEQVALLTLALLDLLSWCGVDATDCATLLAASSSRDRDATSLQHDHMHWCSFHQDDHHASSMVQHTACAENHSTRVQQSNHCSNQSMAGTCHCVRAAQVSHRVHATCCRPAVLHQGPPSAVRSPEPPQRHWLLGPVCL